MVSIAKQRERRAGTCMTPDTSIIKETFKLIKRLERSGKASEKKSHLSRRVISTLLYLLCLLLSFSTHAHACDTQSNMSSERAQSRACTNAAHWYNTCALARDDEYTPVRVIPRSRCLKHPHTRPCNPSLWSNLPFTRTSNRISKIGPTLCYTRVRICIACARTFGRRTILRTRMRERSFRCDFFYFFLPS